MIAALRGLAVLRGEAAESRSETELLVDVLSTHPQIASMLHNDDSASVILRVTIHGATFGEPEIVSALTVAGEVVAFLRAEAQKAT